MKIHRVEDFHGGWIVGNFQPSIIENTSMEVGVKHFHKGQSEEKHFQKIATEVTVVVSGVCRIGQQEFQAGTVIVVEPMEAVDFEALTDCTLVAIKSPSIPSDKILGEP